jgi:hypothetical protein
MKTFDQHNNMRSELNSALEHRDQGTIEKWVDSFLRGTGVNIPLADGLLLVKRWWIGPHEIPLNKLTPTCGPGLEYHEEQSDWDARIHGLAQKIEEGLIVPPLITEFKNNKLSLSDGNHRFGALQSLNITKYWTVVWFNSEPEWAEFKNNQSLLIS